MQGIGRQQKPYGPPSSDELIETFSRTGRPEDFEQIVRRFAALVLCNCRRVTGNAHDAEDASQLVFLALAMEIKSGKTIRRLGPWLQRVANRQSLKIVRSRGRRQKRENAVRRSEMHLVDADAPMDATITAGIVRDAIDELPERYRLPVILHYFGGMSLDAIAGELKLKRQAVGTRLFRGRKMLAGRLAKHGVKLDANALSMALAVLVPTAVIASVIKTATDLSVPTTAATSMIPVGSIFRAVALAAAQRPMRIAAIGLVLLCGGSGMAWSLGVKALDLRKLRIDPIGWLHRMFQFRARPMLTEISAPPVESHEAEQAIEQLLPPMPRVETVLKSLPVPVIQSPPQYIAASSPPSPKPIEQPRVEPVQSNQTFALVPPTKQPIALPPPLRSENVRVDVGSIEQTHENLDVGVASEETLALDSKDLHLAELRLGVMPSGNGTLIQTGGRVVADRVVVGDKGRGVYELQHGRLEAGQIIIANAPHSHGEFDVGGGQVMLNDSAGDLTVGLRGSGRLFVGTQFSPGTVTAMYSTNVPLIVRANIEADGIVQGWGTVGTGGELVNNGQVIADGFNHQRTLNLSSFSKVVNSIDNPLDGQNGWYVQRGGRILLPPLTLQAGTQTYTWGESDQDLTLDLVNSLRLQVHNQPALANLSVSLRTVALADPLDVALPSQMSVVGLWQFDASNFNPTMVDVLVRYNDRAANVYYFGESALQLLAYDGEWRFAGSLRRDSTSKWIGGDFDSAFTYLAVGVPWTVNFVPPVSELLNNGVVPEPTGFSIGIIASALLLRRRRAHVQ